MIALDTNILARYIVQDDRKQAALAGTIVQTHCTDASPGFVTQLVLAELFWVLARGYGYPKEVLLDVFSKLLSSTELLVENPDEAWRAWRAYETGAADFADYLIGIRGVSAGCDSTLTFDKTAGTSGFHTLIS